MELNLFFSFWFYLNRFYIDKKCKRKIDKCLRFFTKICLYNSKNVLNLHPPTLQGVGASKGTALECVELAHGVIGNTPVFGAVIQGSSPCGPTFFESHCLLMVTFLFWKGYNLTPGREVYPALDAGSPCGPTIIRKVSNFYLGLFLWNRSMAHEIVGGLRKRKCSLIKLRFLLRNALLS